MESIKQFQKSETHSSLPLRNIVQLKLAERHCVNCSNADLVDYIFNELSPKFARFLEKNPEFLNEFATNTEKALEKAEAQLALHDKVL